MSRLQLVDHRQGDTDRKPQTGGFRQERQAPFDRRGVDDHHDAVRRRLAETAREHLDRDRLVFRLRLEAVDAGQVDQPDIVGTEPSLEIALTAVDRYTRVVPRLGPMPGEGVEQGRLARVRRPQDRDAPRPPAGARSVAAGPVPSCAGLMDPDPPRLAAAQTQERAAKLVHRGIAERRPSNEPDWRSGAEADLPEASAVGTAAGYLGDLKQPPVAGVGHVGQGSVHFGPGEYQLPVDACLRRQETVVPEAGFEPARPLPGGGF